MGDMNFWRRWLRQPQTTLVRRALFQVHVCVGLAIGVYVLIVSLSGSVLVYRNELYEAFAPTPTIVSGTGPALTIEEATQAARRAYPDYEIGSVRAGRTANHAIDVTLLRDGETTRRILHPFTGEDLGNPVPTGFRFTAWLLDLHDNLLSGETGRRVNGVGGLLIVVLCLTGLVVWWPGVTGWRRSLGIERRAGWKRQVWSLHSALGFWFFAFILMWGLTGLYLSYQEHFAAWFDALEPFNPDDPAERTVDRVQYWLSYVHFGRLGGRGIPWCGRGLCNEVTKATWAAAGIVPAVMFVTGAMMWWSRVLRPRMRRSGQTRPTAARA